MVEILIDKYQDRQINRQIDRKMVEILRDRYIDIDILTEGYCSNIDRQINKQILD